MDIFNSILNNFILNRVLKNILPLSKKNLIKTIKYLLNVLIFKKKTKHA